MGSVVNNIRSASQNLLINGMMEFAQRSTSNAFSGTSTVYRVFDRWTSRPGGTSPSGTITRDTDVPNTTFRYSCKSVGSGGSSGISFYQKIEADVIRPWIGQTVTFSIWLKQSVASSGYALRAVVPVSGVIDSWNADVAADTQVASTTPIYAANTWTQVSLTFTVPASAQFGMAVGFDGAATSGTTSWATGAMLTLGSGVPATFIRSGIDVAGELAKCQRFFEKSYLQATPVGTAESIGVVAWNTPTSNVEYTVAMKVTKRIVPTIVIYDPTATNAPTTIRDNTAGTSATSSVPNIGDAYFVAKKLSGGTAGNEYIFHWTADAEL